MSVLLQILQKKHYGIIPIALKGQDSATPYWHRRAYGMPFNPTQSQCGGTTEPTDRVGQILLLRGARSAERH